MKSTAGKSFVSARGPAMYDLQNSIIRVLAYFDMFAYPVSMEEIQFFLDTKAAADMVQQGVQQLLRDEHIFRHDRFYSLRDDSSLAGKRMADNKRADDLMATARRVAAFLYRFPYVRGIGISGSLSKNVATAKSDIDFFIITQSNRLWIARTLMHLYKKLTYLTGRQHWYCMNYYIDEEALRIEEQNIFTATELITLIPVSGNGTMQNFFTANEWASLYYPSYENKAASSKTACRKYWLKSLVEWMFNNNTGNRIDNYLQGLTAKRYRKKEKEKKLNQRGIPMSLHTGKHFSKPNPSYFQHNMLALYKNKLNAWESKRGKEL